MNKFSIYRWQQEDRVQVSTLKMGKEGGLHGQGQSGAFLLKVC